MDPITIETLQAMVIAEMRKLPLLEIRELSAYCKEYSHDFDKVFMSKLKPKDLKNLTTLMLEQVIKSMTKEDFANSVHHANVNYKYYRQLEREKKQEEKRKEEEEKERRIEHLKKVKRGEALLSDYVLDETS